MRRTYSPPKVIMKKCTGCSLCVEECPAFVLEMTDTKAAVVRGDWCIGCGHCGAVCPEGAIQDPDLLPILSSSCSCFVSGGP